MTSKTVVHQTLLYLIAVDAVAASSFIFVFPYHGLSEINFDRRRFSSMSVWLMILLM